jgi:hypothetical protein
MSGTFMGGGLAVWAADAELAALGLDPWTDRGWAAQELSEYAGTLSSRRMQVCEAVETAVLERHRKRALEQWMVPLVERELALDPMYGACSRILPVAEAALREGTQLLFVID